MPLKLWPSAKEFSELYPYWYDLKPVVARMMLGPGIDAARQRPNSPELKYLQLSCYNCRDLPLMSGLRILIQAAAASHSE